ncbi:MAG: hypothetical protein JNM84_08200, partial [Planctomycetes bacterium]|nr:hypothetical protein [Planctomycetota bacterium]
MLRWNTLSFAIALVTALGAHAALAQTTWHVDAAFCPGPGNGSPGSPFCRIQDGITAALPGDTVLVAP